MSETTAVPAPRRESRPGAESRLENGPAVQTTPAAVGSSDGRPFVVVGVDGSASAEAAVDWAAEECARRGARLVLLHVREPVVGSVLTVESRRYRARSVGDTVGDLWEQVNQLRESRVDAEGQVEEGTPEQVLIMASEDAELLVVGAEGTGRHRGLLLGEVAQECARAAVCPVVIIPPPGGRQGVTA
ncbi:universal stress protein [Actinopolymorpha singaporensis]|uniref:Nucleotide-binding universal stress protein, UspA family n=1 Tax=Actinopolymorpha singaporensis TaxID=117157 RepID=A0A1H1VVE0_9ACTN|nr:universal stress protein [Actinopolymorpha singaporensis]SDS88742.1 Nucleotide-binding universal stress protein, UspA family [Actinopolymorpha singaporensis]